MSQKEPSEAANFKANAALCASGEIWVLNEVQREVVRHHIALALDAFAAQAVAAHAREPDEAMVDDAEAIICAVGIKHCLNIHPAIARDIWAALAAIGPRRTDRDAVIEECAEWCDDQAEWKGDLHDGIPGQTYRHTAAALRAKKSSPAGGIDATPPAECRRN